MNTLWPATGGTPVWAASSLRLVLASLLAACAGGCSADWVPFSGGALEGPVAAPPEDWRAVVVDEVIRLESQPADPYSVNLWVIPRERWLYVFAGANRANWIEHIEQDPRVRLQAGGMIYELRADRVSDAEEFEAFAQSWQDKYGRRPRNESVTETWLMRLSPR